VGSHRFSCIRSCRFGTRHGSGDPSNVDRAMSNDDITPIYYQDTEDVQYAGIDTEDVQYAGIDTEDVQLELVFNWIGLI